MLALKLPWLARRLLGDEPAFVGFSGLCVPFMTMSVVDSAYNALGSSELLLCETLVNY